MAYRRRQGISRASTFKEEIHLPTNDAASSPSSTLASKAMRASSALRESSFSLDRHHRAKEFNAYEETGDSKAGFWGVLARKAKAMLDDEVVVSPQHEAASQNSSVSFNNSTPNQQSYQSNENGRKSDNHKFRKGLDAIASSLNHIGDTFEKAFEEGRTIVENKTADIIQETRKLQIKRQGQNAEAPYQAHQYANHNPWQPQMQPTQPLTQANQETQLKASRDVAMATAAKAKLLLRELKTVKADLAFAKERCSQLEEENKMLRENRDKGDHREDDELIRLQLETLLAEKSRLANENSIYARENRFLREIVEYHQLTMQDVVYLDECSEEVTEVYPVNGSSGISRVLSITPRSSISEDLPSSETPHETELIFPHQEIENVFVIASESSPEEEDTKRVLESENLPETEDIVAPHNQSREIKNVVVTSVFSREQEDTKAALEYGDLLSSETILETEHIFAPHDQSREIKSVVVLTSGSSPEEEHTKRHLESEDLLLSGILPQTEEIFPPQNRFQDTKSGVVLTSGSSPEEEHTTEDILSSGILPETEQIFPPQNRFQETKSVVVLASDPSPEEDDTRRPPESGK